MVSFRFWALLTVLFYPGLLASCVTEYQPDTINSTPALVVEGAITDQPGPYTIKLSRTAEYSYKSINLLETGARVIIADTLGNQETLLEKGGLYSTKPGGIQGVAGRKYTLTIQTKDGTIYQSDTELLKASPPIDRLYYEYQYNPTALTNDKANQWSVFLDSKDPPTANDFYRWQWTHYEFLNYCRTQDLPDGGRFGIGCCSPCWGITQCYINCINIKSDVAINGKSISHQPITQVYYDAATSYYLEVKQQSLSRAIYDFYKTANQQVSQSGGLFDAAPGAVKGNIHATNRPEALVYGYFAAIGESTSHLLVDRSTGRGQPVYAQVTGSGGNCVTCQNDAYQTPIKPRWWPN